MEEQECIAIWTLHILAAALGIDLLRDTVFAEAYCFGAALLIVTMGHELPPILRCCIQLVGNQAEMISGYTGCLLCWFVDGDDICQSKPCSAELKVCCAGSLMVTTSSNQTPAVPENKRHPWNPTPLLREMLHWRLRRFYFTLVMQGVPVGNLAVSIGVRATLRATSINGCFCA